MSVAEITTFETQIQVLDPQIGSIEEKTPAPIVSSANKNLQFIFLKIPE
jgi:hypothetical protein